MTTIRVIQLGDVHYPDVKDEVVGDIKDPATTAAMQQAIAPKKLKRIFETLDRVKNDLSPCGLLICGDLTTRGDVQQYAECVKYLTANARLDDPAKSPRDHWHVVPGNHDVARKSLTPNDSPFPSLYLPLAAEWSRDFLPTALTFDNTRTSTLLDGDCGVQLYSLNSCVGCGEWRRIPASVRDAVTENIKDLLAGESSPDAAFELVAEQLDAPLFLDDHVNRLCVQLRQLESKRLPFILAHHNLLPQATPRLDIYTELLNSGPMRTRLTSLGRPIIYCHGHIHDDPIEIVSSPSAGTGLLVTVSAPPASEGFNLLTVHFGQNRSPIGIEIVKYRLRKNGDVLDEAPIRIPLTHRKMQSAEIEPYVLAAVKSSDWTMRPVRDVRDQFIAATNHHIQFESLRELLIEAEWLGLAELSNRNADDPKELRVQRTIP